MRVTNLNLFFFGAVLVITISLITYNLSTPITQSEEKIITPQIESKIKPYSKITGEAVTRPRPINVPSSEYSTKTTSNNNLVISSSGSFIASSQLAPPLKIEEKIAPELKNIIKNNPDQMVSVIVMLSDFEGHKEVIETLELNNGENIAPFELGNVVVANIQANKLKNLAQAQEVLHVYSDNEVVAFLESTAVQVNAPIGWASNYTGKGVKIAILDTGVDKNHDMLRYRVVAEKSFVGGNADDNNGHGTHMAGVAAGANTSGRYNGIAPEALIINAKVLSDNGTGTSSSVIAGINWAVENGARVISLSLGTAYSDINDPVNLAINDAIEKGVVVVAASGNCGGSCASQKCGNFTGVSVPGDNLNAITVGAVDRNNVLACFSSGSETNSGIKPDLVAPGVEITSAYPNNNYQQLTGTSVSAAYVAGAAAILLEKNLELKPGEVKTLLENSAFDLGDKGKDRKYGYGLVDIGFAVNKTRSKINGLQIYPEKIWIGSNVYVVVEVLSEINETEINDKLKASVRTPSSNILNLSFQPLNSNLWQAQIENLSEPGGHAVSVFLEQDKRETSFTVDANASFEGAVVNVINVPNNVIIPEEAEYENGAFTAQAEQCAYQYSDSSECFWGYTNILQGSGSYNWKYNWKFWRCKWFPWESDTLLSSGTLRDGQSVTNYCTLLRACKYTYDTYYCTEQPACTTGWKCNADGRGQDWKGYQSTSCTWSSVYNCNNNNYHGAYEYYCSGSEIRKKQRYYDYGCSSGSCTIASSNYVNDQSVQNCDSLDGYSGASYCSGNNVVRNYNNYYCSSGQSTCSSTTNQRIVQDCTSTGKLCSSGACINPTISSATWSTSSTTDGTLVTLTTTTNGFNGQSVTFEIWESDDFALWTEHDYVTTLSTTVNNGRASAMWTARWLSDSDGPLWNTGDPEFFFIVKVGATTMHSGLLSVTKVACSVDSDCGPADSCDAFGSNYCSDGDVYSSRTCYDRGCGANACFTRTYDETQKVQECGVSGYSGGNYCFDGDVYRDYLNQGCSSSACFTTSEKQKQEECSGRTVITGSNYCSSDSRSVLRNNTITEKSGCSGSSCISTTSVETVTVQTCSASQVCSSGGCVSGVDLYVNSEDITFEEVVS